MLVLLTFRFVGARMRCDAMGWDAMGWDRMAWDGVG